MKPAIQPETERVDASFVAPRSVIAVVLSLAAGGSGVYAATRVTTDKPTGETAVLRAEVLAAANAHTDLVSARAAEDRHREIAAAAAVPVQAVQGMTAAIARFEGKLDGLSEAVSDLRAEVAGLKAAQRR